MTKKIIIPILYEDSNYVVINKPPGIVVHADGKTPEGTLVDWILEHYPDIKEVGEPMLVNAGLPTEKIIYRPGIVHRLDRDTSGVMVIAKTQEAFLHLKEQFQNRGTQKIYNAFVYGKMQDDDGHIDRPIGRSKKDFRLWSAQRGARGEMRDAVTDFTVLERGKGFTYVEVQPKTGRTHQIRVHFKAINFPIVADPLYAPKREQALGFTRLALHARSLTFTSLEGKKIKVEAPLPADFQEALVNLASL